MRIVTDAEAASWRAQTVEPWTMHTSPPTWDDIAALLDTREVLRDALTRGEREDRQGPTEDTDELCARCWMAPADGHRDDCLYALLSQLKGES